GFGGVLRTKHGPGQHRVGNPCTSGNNDDAQPRKQQHFASLGHSTRFRSGATSCTPLILGLISHLFHRCCRFHTLGLVHRRPISISARDGRWKCKPHSEHPH